MSAFRDYFVLSFDGVTLHNGTTLIAVNRIQEVSRPRPQILTLPDGTKYDNMPATAATPLVPGTVTQEIALGRQTWGQNQTTLTAIAAKLGVRGTLTFKATNGVATYTATARMTGLQNLTPPALPSAREFMRLVVTFELLTNPA